MPGMPQNRSPILTARNKNLTLLSFQFKFLNFKENIGTSLTKSQHDNKMAIINIQRGRFNIQLLKPTTDAPQNKALAGTGNPKKELT